MNQSLTNLYARTASPPRDDKAKRQKKDKSIAMSGESAPVGFRPVVPDVTLKDMAGIDKILHDVKQLMIYPLTHPEVFAHLGVKPPTGVLLHGPPGCGKTMLGHAIAGTAKCTFFKLAATEIVSGMSGESEAKIRELFTQAKAAAPALIFLDEIDAITPKRDTAGKEMERRIVAQLLACMDDLRGSSVMVLGATNRPDSLDPGLRRAGRFDREICIGIPDEEARVRILSILTRGMRLDEDVNCEALAHMTSGFVGADLTAVKIEAAISAVRRVFKDITPAQAFTEEELEPVKVTMADFTQAVKKVQPSSRREGFTMVPSVTWDQVGALAKLRKEMELAICAPIKYAKVFKELAMDVPAGCLLFGPPGCGKTLLAKAVANSSNASFISVKGPELLNKYVGESEKAVRQVFQRAATSAPCVIFFDELDSLAPKRQGEMNAASDRVVNQLLTEMDGMAKRSQVFVVAATNRPDIIDPAMLRPGRLDRLLFVPLPDCDGRKDILRRLMRLVPQDESLDFDEIAAKTERFSGADLASLVHQATTQTLKNALELPDDAIIDSKVTMEMFRHALAITRPSVSEEKDLEYRLMAEKMHTKWI